MAYVKQTWVNTPQGGTPLSADRLNHMEDGIADVDARVTELEADGLGGPGGVIDCSTASTTSEINAVTAGAPAGTTIWLGARGSGDEIVADETLILRPNMAIIGAGGKSRLTRIVAGDEFPAGDPLVAAEGWLENGEVADGSVRFVGVSIDCASKTGSHGVVVYHFWSHFEDIQVFNVDAANGFHVTDTASDGVTVSANSHSENRFVSIRVATTTNGGHGFYAESENNISNQDGHLLHSFFSSINGRGIWIARAAGWTVQDNHLYTIGGDAIRLENCFATRVIGNYVENFGLANEASANYVGINLSTVLSGRASVVMGNTVSVTQPDPLSANRYSCYQARAGGSQSRANVVIAGNTAALAMSSEPGTKRSFGYRFGEGSDSDTRMLHVEWSGNQAENLSWWNSPRVVNGTKVTLTDRGAVKPYPPVVLSDATTIATDASLGTHFRVTISGNRTLGVPSNPTDGQVCVWEVTASGNDRTLTLSSSTGGFAFGADVTEVPTIAEDTTTYIQAVYNASANRWRVIGVVGGY